MLEGEARIVGRDNIDLGALGSGEAVTVAIDACLDCG